MTYWIRRNDRLQFWAKIHYWAPQQWTLAYSLFCSIKCISRSNRWAATILSHFYKTEFLWMKNYTVAVPHNVQVLKELYNGKTLTQESFTVYWNTCDVTTLISDWRFSWQSSNATKLSINDTSPFDLYLSRKAYCQYSRLSIRRLEFWVKTTSRTTSACYDVQSW